MPSLTGNDDDGTVTTVAVFHSMAGAGKTSLVYHLAWMYAELGVTVLAADLDPQSDLTRRFLGDDRIEPLWDSANPNKTVFGSFQPLLEGAGEVAPPHVEEIDLDLGLLVGDPKLARAEPELSRLWLGCLHRDERAFRVSFAARKILTLGAAAMEARVVLLDVGSSLGALTRWALIAADHVAVPVAPDLYSIHGLRTCGPTLREWRRERQQRRDLCRTPDLDLPEECLRSVGYIVMPDTVRMDQPANAWERWLERIPAAYREAVAPSSAATATTIADDPQRLAAPRHFRSLMPLAEEARRPMFALRPADGVLSGAAAGVERSRHEFRALAQRIAGECGVDV